MLTPRIINDIKRTFAVTRPMTHHWSSSVTDSRQPLARCYLQLKHAKVDTFVWGTDECSERLLGTCLEMEGLVHWDAPFAITECVEVTQVNLTERRLAKYPDFGSECYQYLEESECYPNDARFQQEKFLRQSFAVVGSAWTRS